jgi:hypothetical protein
VPYVVAPDRPQREKSMKPNEADYFVCRCRLRNILVWWLKAVKSTGSFATLGAILRHRNNN